MTKQNNISYALCFNCASIYPLTHDSQYICPSCGFAVDGRLYGRIIEYAKAAVYFGYNYRKFYEKQLDVNGKITKKAALFDPVTLACFLGVAALSGVIGNMSYDLVKKALRKITKNSNKLNKDIGQNKISFSKDSEINIFIQYVKEFHLDEFSTAGEIKYEINKERIIYSLTETLYPVLSKGTANREKIHEAVKEAFDKFSKADKPSIEDFDSFWKRIE